MAATFIFYLFLLSLPALSGASAPADKSEQNRVLKAYGKLPLYFVENKGQLDPKVHFQVKRPGETLYFTDEGIIFDLFRQKKTEKKSDRKKIGKPETVLQARGEMERLVFTLEFDSPRGKIVPEGREFQSATINSFVGNDKSRWRTGIATYKSVFYKEVYKGIDLKLYGSGNKLEYEFIVHPGGDPKNILMTYHGVEGITTNGNGELLIATAFGELIETKPYIYQEIDGKKVVAGNFAITPPTDQSQQRYSYGFQVASYDPSYPLIIDPTLSYSTYLGGVDPGGYSSDGADWGLGIAIDPSGNAYVTGVTYSVDFPLQFPYQDASSSSVTGIANAFVSKLNASGNDLLYSTYLGGTADDWGRGIAVDSLGNAYVTGETASTDFPTHVPYQAALAGGYDAFITKLDTSGGVLYSTYLGGIGGEHGNAIAVDESGSAYVTGWTASADFPSTEGAFQEENARLPGYSSSIDVFVTKFNASGSALSYSTYLGGVNKDEGYGIAVDISGNAYVTGTTLSNDFPTRNPYQGTLGGLFDAFVAKLSSSGNSLSYSTYLGGDSSDMGYSIAADDTGNAYLTGHTYSTNFPTQNPYQASRAGSVDAFAAKLSTSENVLVYSTYLGGGDREVGYSIAVDTSGNAYAIGETFSNDFPTHNPYQGTFGGIRDVFVTKFSPAGSTLYSTYLGGSNGEQGNSIAVDASGNVFITGFTFSDNFPTLNPFQAAHAGGQDAFIAKLDGTAPPAPSYPFPLYFPHIASAGDWETEICVINRSNTLTINGVFKAYNNAGELISEIDIVALPPHGRKEITVGDEFNNPSAIGYIIFTADSETTVGYTKFYTVGKYRVAIPAVSEVNTGEIYISHIASNNAWWTGVSLFNTTSSPKTLTLEFDNGAIKTKELAAYEHSAFTIKSLFDEQPQTDIGSGVIKGGSGVVGLELFSSIGNASQLSGILLKDDTTTALYYPHLVNDDIWWTGIVTYNPHPTSYTLRITPYNKDGIPLAFQTFNLGSHEKYLGTLSSLNLPEGSAWFKVEADAGVTGFELFGTNDRTLLAGYTGVGIAASNAIFPKLEDDGWTGIAFANISREQANINLTFYNDDGATVANDTLTLEGYSKILGSAENLLRVDTSGATYINYSADREIVGFQLNGSADNMMLDALPGM